MDIKPLSFLAPKDTVPFVKKLATDLMALSRGDRGTFLTDENGRQWRLAARGVPNDAGQTSSAVEIQVSDGGGHWTTVLGLTAEGAVYAPGAFNAGSDMESLQLEHQ